jgi:hypothetical protein
MNSLFRENLRSEPLPYFLGEFVERRDRRYKGDTGRPGDPIIKLFASPFVWNVSDAIRKAGWPFYLRFWFRFPRTQKGVGQQIGDESAGAHAGAKIAFRVKLLEGKVYGESRDSEVSRQRSRRGQSRGTVTKTSRGQFIPNLAVKLLMKRLSCRPIESNHFERHDGPATPLLVARLI